MVQLAIPFFALTLVSVHAFPLFNKRIAQTTIDSVKPWEAACDAAGGGLQCNPMAVSAAATLLAAAANCAQQDAADGFVTLAKTLKSTQMITLAQIFVQQPRNTPTSLAVPYCDQAPKNSELAGLFHCQFQGANQEKFVGGLSPGSPGTVPFNHDGPVTPPGSCPANPAGPIADGAQLNTVTNNPGAPGGSSAPPASSPATPSSASSVASSTAAPDVSGASPASPAVTPSSAGGDPSPTETPASPDDCPASPAPDPSSAASPPAASSPAVAPPAASTPDASPSDASPSTASTPDASPSAASPPAASPSSASLASGNFQLANGQAAQKLNAQFATLTADSPCTAGENACVGSDFAQCVGGKFVTEPCAATLMCAALPLVNSPGTSITCTTQSDAEARIANSGATGGITG